MFVQRQFQKYQKRSADDQQISLLLKDFEDADQLLGRIIESSKAWREAWVSILTVQHRFLCEFDTLYAPIVGASDDYTGHVPVETSEKLVGRTSRLKTEYEDLKRDLIEELNDVQNKMIGPAQDARENLQLARKTIKKREDKKLDYERYQSRVDGGMKKTKLSDRDRGQLTRAQSDLTVATEAYNAADDHLRSFLPPLLSAVWSLQPYLLAAQIQIQNNLLAHYYTMLHTYCVQEGFPSPAPPMDEVIRLWDDAWRPEQKRVEAAPMIAQGKALRKSFTKEDTPTTNGSHRRPSNQTAHGSRVPSVSPARPIVPIVAQPHDTKPSLNHSVSSNSLLTRTPTTDTALTSPSPSASVYHTPATGYAPAGPNVDYFTRDRTYSNHSSHPTTPGAITPGGSSTNLLAGIVKKKPPPPPPPRIPSHHYQFVTALYDFNPQNDGDLAFKEGDKIKVLKKTESTDDWWQGELKGIKGMFPANYVKV